MKTIILALSLIFIHCISNAQEIKIDQLSKHPIKNMTVNAIDYHFIEKGEGETIFFLHGFPDLANTWDETIDSLATKYHCVAPFLRGYYPTGIPKDGDYSSKTIAQDIDLLAQEMGIERYYVVGQDWGASVTYTIANLYPKKVIKAVTVAIPHPSTIKANIKTLYKARHFLKFSNESKSPTYTRKNNFKLLDVLYKRWSPSWKDYTVTSELIKQTFALDGRLEAALGYYWSFNKNRKDKELSAFYNEIPQMPVLTIAGKKDGALVINQIYKMKEVMNTDFKLVVHDHAGHFLHREVPAFFIKELADFLEE